MAAAAFPRSTSTGLLLLKAATGRRATTARTMASSTPSPVSLPVGPIFYMDTFAARQWAPGTEDGTRIDPATCSLGAFCDAVHAAHAAPGASPLVDGYAPFCKHVFVPNFIAGLKPGAVAVTPENEAHLKSAYSRRRPEELAVLTRFFLSTSPPAAARPDATWLDVILYSREQLAKEAAAMPAEDRAGRGGGEGCLPPWGIISVKAQDVPHELPMQPITMLRNALGREEGGSGVKLDRGAYEESVRYWSGHAAVADPRVDGGG
jgi:hypothetical protein